MLTYTGALRRSKRVNDTGNKRLETVPSLDTIKRCVELGLVNPELPGQVRWHPLADLLKAHTVLKRGSKSSSEGIHKLFFRYWH
jgi:hypothetical protein